MYRKVKKTDLETDLISWLSVEPMLISVRGKSIEKKRDVYNQLNDGQRALYIQIEILIEDKLKITNNSWKEARPSDLDKDIELFEKVRMIFDQYQTIVSQTIHIMNDYVKENLEYFFTIVE